MKAALVVVLREILSWDCKTAFFPETAKQHCGFKNSGTWQERRSSQTPYMVWEEKKYGFPSITALASREVWIALEYPIQLQVKKNLLL